MAMNEEAAIAAPAPRHAELGCPLRTGADFNSASFSVAARANAKFNGHEGGSIDSQASV